MADCIDRGELFPGGVFIVNKSNALESLYGLLERIRSAPTLGMEERWIGVGEAMPEDNQKVLVCTRSGKFCVARWSERRGCFVASGNVTVTHWMPLPEPPEVEG